MNIICLLRVRLKKREKNYRVERRREPRPGHYPYQFFFLITPTHAGLSISLIYVRMAAVLRIALKKYTRIIDRPNI